jgi:hypothetical protein
MQQHPFAIPFLLGLNILFTERSLFSDIICVLPLGEGNCFHTHIKQTRKMIVCIILRQELLEMTYYSVILCIRPFFIVYFYTIRGTDIPHFFNFTTCFGLMGPSSGTLGLTITYLFSCYSPYIGQCLHIGSALYVEHHIKAIHTTHSQCVNTGQCRESSRKSNR